jgi:hypothetical protein
LAPLQNNGNVGFDKKGYIFVDCKQIIIASLTCFSRKALKERFYNQIFTTFSYVLENNHRFLPVWIVLPDNLRYFRQLGTIPAN